MEPALTIIAFAYVVMVIAFFVMVLWMRGNSMEERLNQRIEWLEKDLKRLEKQRWDDYLNKKS